MPGDDVSGKAAQYNRATYDRMWGQLSDFIRYNPGARHRRRHVLELLERCRFDSLLDVGCGNGELLSVIDARWPKKRLAGIDLSSAVTERLAREVPHVAFHAKNVESEDLPRGFDVVICSEVLEHLDAPAVAMQRLADATNPGGHVIITVPTGHVWRTEKHFGHVRHPSPDELRGWAADAGLVVEELWSWGFPTYALTKWAQNIRPEMAMRVFAGARPYGMAQIAMSLALWLANFANLRRSPWGVQLFALLKKPETT
jgi:2-polyprenyl-3-methyl-5-hydroxy-6-metoxy-1,4-benzoquinol methylase